MYCYISYFFILTIHNEGAEYITLLEPASKNVLTRL